MAKMMKIASGLWIDPDTVSRIMHSSAGATCVIHIHGSNNPGVCHATAAETDEIAKKIMAAQTPAKTATEESR